ncbi:metallophosphatase-domain-containing phosphoesterase [Yamadazyma tenuis]|uniref:Calcineurin-like phosphoesterase domain-containing protein n=1 Tax=Candida tenuis (strain ATCC 10573 / BCRC 21748 / CBS 615 / JCM 9827 / NBRC 10315 / NRRL Y-1498 / VKM Y-70) TaxID=590646 RepID=G3B4F0_CANTC|nr:uncharacterized protein CANTEDRAFT_134389 [Yamadazyma tenuis ATCC 10573]EGV63807.1 hypothetical protein CANTEDRAFT_134389 [Yamadazyma tenuis ATCC 10573]WEJ96584.1 metallophosphatase-domain-containing phosphoesterase [Yamadazyma tenuis]
MKGFSVLLLASTIAAHAINGMSSIKTQLHKRDELGLIEQMYSDLPFPDQDFITNHLSTLQAFNGSKCDACKNKIHYARKLYDEDPDNQHLIAFTLFKYCIASNKDDPTKCDTVDFFLTTQSNLINIAANKYDSSFGDETSVNLFDNDFMHMLRLFNLSSELDLDYYCYFKGGVCDLPETIDIDSEYNFDSKWPVKQPHHYFEPEYTNGSGDTFNVLHITDFHSQFKYTVGAEGNCSQKICCKVESYNEDLPDMSNYNFTEAYSELCPNGDIDNFAFYPDAKYDDQGNYSPGEYYDLPEGRGWDSVVQPAGVWGNYECDSPVILINNTMKYVRQLQNKNFEFTLFTGDLVDHDKIHDTPAITKEAEVLGFKILKEYLGGIPVYPSLGNHDTFPYGQLAPQKYDPNSSYQYNAELMSEIWVNDGWLDRSEQNEVKEHYAGFSHVTKRGLKVISLNSNAYYQKNMWNYINLREDPDRFGQWEFLINELVESEQKGQRVWIIAHIPSSDGDALPIQSRIFAKIVERFSPYTIASIFYGHTHRDQFKVFFASNSSSAEDVERDVTNMAWIGQSVTPLSDYNPAFKYYEVQDGSFNIMNSYNYYTKLNDTYIEGSAEPAWEFEYSARETYDPNSTWPSTAPLNGTFWNQYVLQKLADNSSIEFNQLYTNLQYRSTLNTPVCDDDGKLSTDCYQQNYCEAGSYLSDEYLKCMNQLTA